MNRHLVTVEVGVESGTDKRMKLDGFTFNKYRLESLNTESMKRGRTVKHNRMILDNGFECVPDLGISSFNGLFGGLDVGFLGTVVLVAADVNQSLHDEGLEQLKSHFLRKTALINLQVRTDNDNRTAGVVNTLTEKILTEASLLTFEHIRKGLERPVVGSCNRAASSSVINKGVNGFLKHSLFVSYNDTRSAEFNQFFQSVVTVDNTAVKVVQVTRRKASAVKLNHRTDIRRNDRNDVENHPFGAVAGVFEGFDNFKAFKDSCGFLSLGFRKLRTKLGIKLIKVDFRKKLLDRFCAHSDAELRIVKVIFLDFFESLVVDYVALIDLGNRTGIDDNVSREIEHSFKILRGHIKHQTDS